MEVKKSKLLETLLKVLGLALGLGLGISLAVFSMIQSAGISKNSGSNPAPPSVPQVELPQTALPVPNQNQKPTNSDDLDTDYIPVDVPNEVPGADGLQLTITPVLAKPAEKINISGTYAGQDNLILMVQHYEEGGWVNFKGAQAKVNLGTFETQVVLTQYGDNQFRMYDSSTGKTSNTITVTVS